MWVVVAIVLICIGGAVVSCAYRQGMCGATTDQVEPANAAANGDSAVQASVGST